MARKFTTSFESGTEWSNFVGAPTVVTTQHNTGTHSLRCHPTSAAAATVNFNVYAEDDPTAHVFMRTYVFVATAPSGPTAIIAWDDESGNTAKTFYCIKMAANRTLFAAASGDMSAGSEGGAASAALALNRWYRVEMDYNDSTGTMKCYLDGTLWTTVTGVSLGGGHIARFGMANPVTGDLYFDDIAINDASGSTDNGLPGPVAPPGRLKVWSGSAWVVKPAKVWTGSAWKTATVQARTSGGWV